MKKSPLLICGIVFGALAVLTAAIFLSFGAYSRVMGKLTRSKGLNDNVNVMLNRPENWEKLSIEDIPVNLEEMGVIDGSTATIPVTAELFRQFFGMSDEEIRSNHVVQHSTTHSAYNNLIYSYSRYYDTSSYNYDTRLILVTPPSAEEMEMALQENVELDMEPVARDGFVFITHKDNPVDSLTVEQVQDIYTGKITNWKEVGGKDRKITAYQREQNSGSQTAMEQLVMQGKTLMAPETSKIQAEMGMLVDVVAEYKNGPSSIGYTYYYYINSLYKNDDIKVIKINGYTPSNKNLINGNYPFSTNYYAVIRGDEYEYSPARRLRDFLVSDSGQRLIEMAGYCRAN